MTRTTRTRKIVLAAGLVLGSLVPAQAAVAWSPPAPSPNDLPIEIGEPGPDDPDPQGPDDEANPPVDPCLKFGCFDDFQAGGNGPDDPGDDTVPGNPDFTG